MCDFEDDSYVDKARYKMAVDVQPALHTSTDLLTCVVVRRTPLAVDT